MTRDQLAALLGEPAAWQERQLVSPGKWGDWYDKPKGWALGRPQQIDSHGIQYQFRPVYSADQIAAALEGLAKDADRYKTVRLLKPDDFLNAYVLNTRTGKHFDEIIDDLKPFFRPAAMKGGA